MFKTVGGAYIFRETIVRVFFTIFGTNRLDPEFADPTAPVRTSRLSFTGQTTFVYRSATVLESSPTGLLRANKRFENRSSRDTGRFFRRTMATGLSFRTVRGENRVFFSFETDKNEITVLKNTRVRYTDNIQRSLTFAAGYSSNRTTRVRFVRRRRRSLRQTYGGHNSPSPFPSQT